MANISDIEKISELGKIDIPNLKLILKELLNDLRGNEERNQDMQVDISAILKLLIEKGFISGNEYENLKDKINSLIDTNTLDSAYNEEISQEVIDEIIKKSHFKGFFPSYEALINTFPTNVAHGDYAYIRDFEAGNYDVNNIEEFIYDINFKKWMSATDTTHLRNFYIDDESGRNNEPLDKDFIQYDTALKRWLCKTYDEANIAQKSAFDNHVSHNLKLVEDVKGSDDGSSKDDGRLIIKPDPETSSEEPLHINKEEFKKLISQIDKDYFTKLNVKTEKNELGIEKIVVTEDDVDQYGNAIRRNVTNEVIREILNNLYGRLEDTFEIKNDGSTGRIISIREDEPRKYVPRTVNTYNIDKIIDAINRDYNNSFRVSDKQETDYATILKRVLKNFKELNVNDRNIDGITERLTKLYEDKKLWDRYTEILDYEKNKNLTPEVFNELIDLLHYLYISKDLIRDEILERDISVNGKKEFKDDIAFSGKKISITNKENSVLINSKEVNLSNEQGTVSIDSEYLNVNNENSELIINSKNIHFKNEEGKLNISPNTNFEKDVIIKGNLTIAGTATAVNTENTVIKDNIIVLNKGEANGEVSRRASGFSVDRGTGDNFFLGYDENRKRLVTGYIKREDQDEFDKLDNIAVLPKIDLDINKPIVYNPETKMLENSEYIKTDIEGAVTFKYTVKGNHDFKVLDCVCFEGGTLAKCNFDTYENCEVVGVVGKVNGNEITVVVSGKIPQQVPEAMIGRILYLQKDGTLGNEYKDLIIQRKVAIQIPDGIIVDIQKNSGWEHHEINREQICHRVVEPFGKIIKLDNSIKLTPCTKVFFDGMLQIRGLHYELDIDHNSVKILSPYSYPIDATIITNIDFAYSVDSYIQNSEIDKIFLKDKERQKRKAKQKEEGTESELTEEEKEMNKISYPRMKFYEPNNQKNVYREGEILYFVVKEKLFDKYDFIVIGEDGKYKKLSNRTETVIGIIEDVQTIDNLIEYKLNTSKVISYNEIKLQDYSDKYKVEFNYGDTIYISDKINKFSGRKIGTFSEYGLFLEYTSKRDESIPVPKEPKDKQINLKGGIYYKVPTEKLSINTINLFEVDSPNYCQFNLVNNTNISEKNLFVEILSGKKIFQSFRRNDEFVIMPAEDVVCKSKVEFIEINSENLIAI